MANDDERSPFIVCMNVINSLTHLILGAVVMCALIFAIRLPISGSLTQHVFLCVLGYILMMAQAVLAFSPHTGWSRALRQQDKKLVHWVMQVTGAVLAIIGSIIRISNLNNNFQSAHGIFGLLTMIMAILSLIGGVANIYLNSTLALRLGHSIAGSITIFFAFLTLCLGFGTNVFRITMGDDISGLAITLTVFGLIGVLISATVSNIKKITNR